MWLWRSIQAGRLFELSLRFRRRLRLGVALLLERQWISVAANLLILSAEAQPQAFQRGAWEGPHFKTLTQAHQRRQLQGEQPLGDAITEAKTHAHQQRYLPQGTGMSWRSCFSRSSWRHSCQI